MERKEKVLEASENMIEDGGKVSASQLADRLEWPEQDVHRCLNALEKEERIRSSVKKFAGRKIRIIGVLR